MTDEQIYRAERYFADKNWILKGTELHKLLEAAVAEVKWLRDEYAELMERKEQLGDAYDQLRRDFTEQRLRGLLQEMYDDNRKLRGSFECPNCSFRCAKVDPAP